MWLSKLKGNFAIDRAGLVGADGPTHHGVFDISYLRTIPHQIIAAPKDEQELRDMLFSAITTIRMLLLQFDILVAMPKVFLLLK
jgi:1-deoxy-D-xylulose-5-phosphate synthase